MRTVSKLEAVSLLREVCADYTAMAREAHRLRKLPSPFDETKLPLIAQMFDMIKRMEADIKDT